MNTDKSKLYYSVNEALEASSIGRTRFYELVRAGAIAGVRKAGSRTVVSVEGLKAYLDSLPEIARA